jgi:DNA (cytosine-5)-methyltransferase 1
VWWVKSRRAQNENDFESWLEKGTVPTLNAFDNATETRATVVIYSVREDAKANNFSATQTDTALALQANRPSVQSHHAQLFIAEPLRVRRLTPLECERLQGFPDGWTGDQADSNRYKQMGNAVAVPVVQWIINNVVGE